MEPESYKRFVATAVRTRALELRRQGVRTSKGEKMSLAAIARTLDPPVSRISVYLVVDGKSESRRIKEAVERELQQPFWIRRVG